MLLGIIYNPYALPKADFKALLKYVEELQGQARTTALAEAKKFVENGPIVPEDAIRSAASYVMCPFTCHCACSWKPNVLKQSPNIGTCLGVRVACVDRACGCGCMLIMSLRFSIGRHVGH